MADYDAILTYAGLIFLSAVGLAAVVGFLVGHHFGTLERPKA